MVTECEIAPQTFYKGSFAVQSRPGFATGLIVQRPGGAMNFNGLQLATMLDGFPDYEAPKIGEEMILFLTRSEMEPGKFRMIGNAFGAFRIAEGKVAALIDHRETQPQAEPDLMIGRSGKSSDIRAYYWMSLL